MINQPWGFWDYERIVMQCVVLMLFTRVFRTLRRLLKQGVDDRSARMLAIDELKKTADRLAEKTAIIAEAVLERDKSAARILDGRLNDIDAELHRNTALTQNAALASSVAADVANAVNDKIAETNKRLMEHVEGSEKKQGF